MVAECYHLCSLQPLRNLWSSFYPYATYFFYSAIFLLLFHNSFITIEINNRNFLRHLLGLKIFPSRPLSHPGRNNTRQFLIRKSAHEAEERQNMLVI